MNASYRYPPSRVLSRVAPAVLGLDPAPASTPPASVVPEPAVAGRARVLFACLRFHASATSRVRHPPPQSDADGRSTVLDGVARRPRRGSTSGAGGRRRPERDARRFASGPRSPRSAAR